jgi:hypothetical protein
MVCRIAALLIVWTLSPLARGADAKQELLSFLPDQLVAGVSPAGPAEHFPGQGLFDYMDGGAELYLAYGFTDVAVRPYAQGDRKANLEIYKMGGPLDGFGILATQSKGERVEVEAGVGANQSLGMVNFFKGAHYVRIVAVSPPDKTKELLLTLARAAAGRIPGEAKIPAEAALLPEGAIKGSLRYLPNPETARTVWFDGEGELVLLPGARAFTAGYAGADGDLQATRIAYPTAADAAKACAALLMKLGLKPDPASKACAATGQTPDDAVSAIATDGAVLRWLQGASDPAAALAWLKKIR